MGLSAFHWGFVLAGLFIEKQNGLKDAQDFASRIIFECNDEDLQSQFIETWAEVISSSFSELSFADKFKIVSLY